MILRCLNATCALALGLSMATPCGAQGTEFHLSVDETTPPVKRGGPLLAKVIKTEQDLVPGLLADGNLGDIVLQNDFARAILTHPERQVRLAGGPGALVDIVHRSFPSDGLDYIQTTADTQSSVGLVRYNKLERLEIVGDSTPTLIMSGTANPIPGEPPLQVRTSYELPRDEAYLLVTTTYTNPSKDKSASLLPGDIADWGALSTFAEGMGAVNDLAIRQARFVAGIDEDVTVAFLNTNGAPLEAIVAQRLAVIQHYGPAVIPDIVLNQLDPIKAAILRGETPPPAPPEPIMVWSPAGLRPLIVEPGTETPYSIPDPESPYGLPGNETQYNLPGVETKIGADARSTSLRAWDAEIPGGDEPRPVARTVKRLVLAPGQSATFQRIIAVSNRDMGRIVTLSTRLAAEKSALPAGAITGVVLDSATATPLPGTDLFLLGGSDFDGTKPPVAIARMTTRPDGTFGVRLPHGNYMIQANLMGYQQLSPSVIATVGTTSPLVTMPIGMTGRSAAQVTVKREGSDELLPAKVTLVAKPGTPPAWFGSSENVTSGSRNVFYLPQGTGTFPVTPGRYEMTVSRGPEYDIVRGELTVVPGATQSISINLPHSLAEQAKGHVSVDAGVMTNASPAGTLDAESRVIQAVCEGVQVLVTGDYGVATDLNPVIHKLGLQDKVKAFVGRRWLLSADGMTMELFAYPLNPQTHAAMAAKIDKERSQGTAPDVILADLRREFPQVILQIDRPGDPDKGYLQSFKFNELRRTYGADNMPPPDFDALQVVDGKRLAVQDYTLDRYYDLATRYAAGQKGLLAAAGGSNSRVAMEEVGSIRTYIRTQRDTLSRFDEDTLTTSIRTGRYFLTNGPLMDLQALDPQTNAFSARVGDMINCLTTRTAVVRPVVYAAPWVGVNSITVYMDGTIADRTEVMPLTRPMRYPVQADINSANKVRYLDGDTLITATSIATRRVMSPVLSPLPEILGGEVVPWAMTGPILVDFNGDQRVTPTPRSEN